MALPTFIYPKLAEIIQPTFTPEFTRKLVYLDQVLSTHEAHEYIERCGQQPKKNWKKNIQTIVGATQIFISAEKTSFWETGFRQTFYDNKNAPLQFIEYSEMVAQISATLKIRFSEMGKLKINSLAILCKNGWKVTSGQPCHVDCASRPAMGKNQEMTGTMVLGKDKANTSYWHMPSVGIFVTEKEFSNQNWGWSDCPPSLVPKLLSHPLVQKYGRVWFALPEQIMEQSETEEHQITVLSGYTPHCGPSIPKDTFRNAIFWSLCNDKFIGKVYNGYEQMSKECLVFAVLSDQKKMNWTMMKSNTFW
jgi:hypothetical protein